MEIPEMINDKKTRRYKAGDVVVMEYSGDGKPCDKAMAILLTSFTLKDGCVQDGKFRTMYAIDTDKEQFLPSGPIATGGVVCCNIAKATPKLKAWYFEQIVKHCQKPAEPKKRELEWQFDEQAFIEEYCPMAGGNDYLGWIDDICKLLDGEAEPGDAASTGEYANMSEDELRKELKRLTRIVLKQAVDEYVERFY